MFGHVPSDRAQSVFLLAKVRLGGAAASLKAGNDRCLKTPQTYADMSIHRETYGQADVRRTREVEIRTSETCERGAGPSWSRALKKPLPVSQEADASTRWRMAHGGLSEGRDASPVL